jgi:hypothetical protein
MCAVTSVLKCLGLLIVAGVAREFRRGAESRHRLIPRPIVVLPIPTRTVLVQEYPSRNDRIAKNAPVFPSYPKWHKSCVLTLQMHSGNESAWCVVVSRHHGESAPGCFYGWCCKKATELRLLWMPQNGKNILCFPGFSGIIGVANVPGCG